MEDLMNFSLDKQKRYARHFALSQVGEAGQQKLKNSRVLIIGAGGLGNPVALYLTAAGIGQIAIVDHDDVSLENLQRQILYKTADISKNKAFASEANLHAVNPNVKILALSEYFDSKNAAALLNDYDIVVDASDNFETRYFVNRACVLAKKTLVYGAIFRFDGQVGVFNHKGSSCYACLYPNPPAVEAVPNCSESGVLGVLPGVVGTLMATEVLKIILEIGSPLSDRIVAYDALATHFQTLKVTKNLSCKVCSGQSLKDTSIDISSPGPEFEISKNTLRELLLSPSPPHLIDVRSFEEFASFHIPNSKNVPLHLLAQEIGALPKENKIVFICQSGIRSARAIEILRATGRQDLFHLTGGLNAFNT